MKSALSGAAVWIAALWWGSLTTVGFYVVPMLFAHLPTPALAGNMAGKLFSAQTWVAVVCGLLLLLSFRSNRPTDQYQQAPPATTYIVTGMFLACLSEFAVAPHIIARDNLRLWHSLGTGLYALQWVCAGLTLKKLLPGKPVP
jgi:hypothetical protein